MAQKCTNNFRTEFTPPFPQELNELDWKLTISQKSNKLAKHLSAFANNTDGGYLVFGIKDKSGDLIGVNKADSNKIVERLANIAREALKPEVVLDHAM